MDTVRSIISAFVNACGGDDRGVVGGSAVALDGVGVSPLKAFPMPAPSVMQHRLMVPLAVNATPAGRRRRWPSVRVASGVSSVAHRARDAGEPAGDRARRPDGLAWPPDGGRGRTCELPRRVVISPYRRMPRRLPSSPVYAGAANGVLALPSE
jgi:hypothetical protein